MFENYGMQELSATEMESVNGGGMLEGGLRAIYGFIQAGVEVLFNLWNAFF